MNAKAKWKRWLMVALGASIVAPVVMLWLGPGAFTVFLVVVAVCSAPMFGRAVAATFPRHFPRKHGGTLPLAFLLLASGAVNPSEARAAVYPGETPAVFVCSTSNAGIVQECDLPNAYRQCSECSLAVVACAGAVWLARVAQGQAKVPAIIAAYGTCGVAAWQCGDCFYEALQCDLESLKREAQALQERIEQLVDSLPFLEDLLDELGIGPGN